MLYACVATAAAVRAAMRIGYSAVALQMCDRQNNCQRVAERY